MGNYKKNYLKLQMDNKNIDISNLNLGDLARLNDQLKRLKQESADDPKYNTCCCCAFDQWWANSAYALTLFATCYHFSFYMDWWWYVYIVMVTPQLAYSLCC